MYLNRSFIPNASLPQEVAVAIIITTEGPYVAEIYLESGESCFRLISPPSLLEMYMGSGERYLICPLV